MSSSSRVPKSSRSSSASLRPVLQPSNTIGVGYTLAHRYLFEKVLGRGGMGIVYATVDIETGAQLAVKMLHARAYSLPNIRRFQREARIAGAIEHKSVCRVYGVGMAQNTPYIAMERLTGESARQRLRAAGPFSIADAVGILVQVLDVLTAAHAVGILHRDVKPGNVFITSRRETAPSIRLIDFGLAKILPGFKLRSGKRDENTTSITTAGVIPGTPFYLSPEQLAGAPALDQRVDVWAAGVTLYELLSGARPFTARTYAQLAQKIVQAPFPSIRDVRADVPKGFDEVLAIACAKSPSGRYPTASTFRDALVSLWARHRFGGRHH